MKNLIPLVVAVVLGLAAVFAVSRTLASRDDTQEEKIEIVSASRMLDAGETLTEGFINPRVVSASSVPKQRILWGERTMILGQKMVHSVAKGDYVLPETVAANPEAEAIYRHAFQDQAMLAEEARSLGIDAKRLGYFAMSGHELDIVVSMNARELLHFMRLRTCSRAQWEIRGVAWRMLALLRETLPELFDCYGPSCRFGPCPEGKMTCGKPQARI